MGHSVGIGLTNGCSLTCAHFYRDSRWITSTSLNQVEPIYETIPVDSIGSGTGENALHPELFKIVEYLHTKGIRLSIVSNAYCILSAFHDIEFSIDYPLESAWDDCHGLGIVGQMGDIITALWQVDKVIIL